MTKCPVFGLSFVVADFAVACVFCFSQIQKKLGLPVSLPPTDCITRWTGACELDIWFDEQKPAVMEMFRQTRDWEMVPLADKSTYVEQIFGLSDWTVIMQSACVLRPMQRRTLLLESSKQVTISLVLPFIANTQDFLSQSSCNSKNEVVVLTSPSSDAKEAMALDFDRRWEMEMPDAFKEDLYVCTFLDVRYKNGFKWVTSLHSLVSLSLSIPPQRNLQGRRAQLQRDSKELRAHCLLGRLGTKARGWKRGDNPGGWNAGASEAGMFKSGLVWVTTLTHRL